MNDRKNIFVSVVITLFILFVAVCFFISKSNEKSLKAIILKDSIIVTGQVDSFHPSGNKYSCTIQYSFLLGVHTFSKESSSYKYEPLNRHLVGKTFPVIVNIRNDKYNRILILPEDFKEFGIPFPDSLQWVKDILK